MDHANTARMVAEERHVSLEPPNNQRDFKINSANAVDGFEPRLNAGHLFRCGTDSHLLRDELFLLASRSNPSATTFRMRVEILLQLQPEGTFGTAQSLESNGDSGRDVQFAIAQFLQVGFADPKGFAGFCLAHTQRGKFVRDGETWVNDSSGQ
jgi:hypothetical protein